MAERSCEKIRARLALGEREAPAVRRHLESCRDCRAEASWLRLVTAGLAAEPEAEVPAALDRRVRALLAAPALAPPRFPRPSLAAGLAVSGLVALTAALAVALAQTGAGEHGAVLAVGITVGYLALSTAATLPLLVVRKRHELTRMREVWR